MSRPAQGDIYLPTHPVAGKDASGGIVVITNECDLAHCKTELVSILPIFVVIPELLKKFGISEKDWNYWFNVVNQTEPRTFFLPPNKKAQWLYGAWVELQQIKTVRLEIFNSLAPITRIHSPYKELLITKIANLLNRIPIDTPGKPTIKQWFQKVYSKK